MTRRGEAIAWSMALELAPAALFGCAAAFGIATALALPLASAGALVFGAAAGCGAWLLLRGFRGPEAFPMPQFEQVPIDSHPADDCPAQAGELLLDDVLARVGPGSRVIRLFDRQPVPPPCEPDEPLDRQLRSAVRPIPTPPDATEALHEALAVLRQSLR